MPRNRNPNNIVTGGRSGRPSITNPDGSSWSSTGGRPANMAILRSHGQGPQQFLNYDPINPDTTPNQEDPSPPPIPPIPPDPPPDPEISSVSALIQTFSAANYWSRTGIVDLVPGTTIGFLCLKSANSGNQTIWGCCGASAGWHITISGGAGGRVDIYMRGGANPFYPLNGAAAAPNGYFWLFLTRTAGGAFRSCINGLAVAQPSAAPAYVSNDGSSIETIGRVQAAVGTNALANGGVVATCFLNRAATDAELIEWSGQIAATDRFDFATTLKTAIASVSGSWGRHARDWDGSAASWSTTRGDLVTLARQGTGGAKSVIPAFQRYLFDSLEDLRNCDFFATGVVGIPAGLIQGNHFASTKFATTAQHVIIDVDPVNNGSLNDSDRIGIEVDGVSDATSQNIWGFDTHQTIDRIGLSALSKNIEAINNYHEFSPDGVGGHVNYGIGISITGIRTPVASPPTFDLSTPPAVLLIVGNSMTGKVVGGGGALTGSTIQSYPMLARRNIRASAVPDWTGGSVTADGWGGRNWFDVCSNATKRNEFAPRHVAALRGTVKNTVYWCLDINDYILNPWAGDTAAFSVALGAYLDLFKTLADAAGVVNPTYILGTSQPKTDESPVGGRTAQNYRDATTTVGNARGWLTVVQGPTMTSPADLGDGLHFHAAGHAVMEAALRSHVGY